MSPTIETSHTAPQLLYTLYLFIKVDILTMALPVLLFATLTSKNTSILRGLNATLWTFAHLLQYCVSNQTRCSDAQNQDDNLNKPWRPLPSGRISMKNARALRWALLPLCFLLSTRYGLVDLGILMAGGMYLNNEWRWDRHWLTRAVLNAIAYGTWDMGATVLSFGGRSPFLAAGTLRTIISNSLIVLTTIHAADFCDEEGDRAEGRKSLPIVTQGFSRLSITFLLPFWSAVIIWANDHGVKNILDFATLTLALFLATRFYTIRDPREDRKSYVLYNIWLLMIRLVQISPIYQA
ncbi:hypothetical protein D9613_007343 [Agrocybe pediades]|uniref:Uncharacterized protein n=1 Tax=Agrocybe pediades TaxID=84607 RepID=A0A8H4VHZ7_9AGAR|nr:hypothetical protein D9613_007343 [Agrocybe pediades]